MFRVLVYDARALATLKGLTNDCVAYFSRSMCNRTERTLIQHTVDTACHKTGTYKALAVPQVAPCVKQQALTVRHTG